MEWIIELLQMNIWLSRIIWFAMGFVGVMLFNKTRPSFYKNHPLLWNGVMWFYYACLGPLVFVLALLSLINPEKEWKV